MTGEANKKIPQTYVKNLAVQLPDDYSLSNAPFDINKKSSESDGAFFIGREELKKKFQSFLKSSNKGVYLVTGYRGMGKTSFVSHVLSDYIFDDKDPNQIPKKRVIPIHLTLAQSNPNELDVLRQIVNSINDRFKSPLKKKLMVLLKCRNAAIFFAAAFILLNYLDNNYYNSSKNFFFNSLFTFQLSLLLIFVFQYLIYHFTKKNKAFNRLKSLFERCNSQVVKEDGLINRYGGINDLIGKLTSKNTKNFPLADTKIIEYELNQFLDEANKEKIEFIFIFDELDKIDFNQTSFNPHEDLESFEKRGISQNYLLRNRKEAIVSIITGLKNFFTTAKARFIFIAGREMFEASLADIADKQSPLGSIFTYTFHIESLLKEDKARKGNKNKSSISIAIQEFLKHQLFSKKSLKEIPQIINHKDFNNYGNDLEKWDFYDLLHLYYFHDNKNHDEFKQFYFMMHAFETYLVYRSSGSPKKLIKAFQEFVCIGRDDINVENDKLSGTTNIKRIGQCDSQFYLYFNFNNQYRIGFINAFYRPFIIQNGRSFKNFSENTIIGMPYLFDQIFKFHPFAFSLSNLEYIPEILTSSRTPNIRKDLNLVINYLYQNYIRDTDIQLFDYKFKSKTANEISYVSRIFEEEAAAFNFTLDESYPIKNILIEKIKELRSIHSKFVLDNPNFNQQLFSIANHNANLADLYFFDQEFDDAITCYSDAIRAINNIEISRMNHRDFILLTRNKLKLGLCFEKISSFEDALAFYTDSIIDIKRFFSFYLKNSKYVDIPKPLNQTTTDTEISQINYEPSNSTSSSSLDAENYFYTSSMNDILQIGLQSFIANMYIQEKMGLEGITTPKTKMEFSDFFKIVDAVSFHIGRNNMIIANCLYHHANLLYYKNTGITTPKSNDENKNNYPNWYSKRIKEIRKYFTFDDKINDSRRQPWLALKVYLLGLDEVMRSKKCFNFVNPNNCDELLVDNNTTKNRVKFLQFYLNNLKPIAIDSSTGDAILYNPENFSSLHFKYFANFLSSIGNCILSTRDIEGQTVDDSVKVDVTILFDILTDSSIFYDSIAENTSANFNVTDVLQCYYLSALFFEKFGRISSAILQYRKIIHTLMLVSKQCERSNEVKAKYIVSMVERDILNKAKELFNTGALQTSSHMKNKIKEDFEKVNTTVFKDNTIEINQYELEYKIAGNSEIKEITLLFEQFKLNLLGYKVVSELDDDYEKKIKQFINPFNSISTQYLRLTELDFYVKYLYKRIESDIKSGRNSNTKSKIIDNKFYKENKTLFEEYIFSKHAIIRTLKIYETDYMLGPAYLAYVHDTLADFLSFKISGTRKRIYQDVDKNSFVIYNGKDSKVLFDVHYHINMAIDYYNKAIELHTTRSYYRKHIKEMIYLEDDFNDNNYHFGAAIERYLMVNDSFIKKIEKLNELKKELKNV